MLAIIAFRSLLVLLLEYEDVDDVEEVDVEVPLELLSNELLLISTTRSFSRTSDDDDLRSSADLPSADRRFFDLSLLSADWPESLLSRSRPL